MCSCVRVYLLNLVFLVLHLILVLIHGLGEKSLVMLEPRALAFEFVNAFTCFLDILLEQPLGLGHAGRVGLGMRGGGAYLGIAPTHSGIGLAWSGRDGRQKSILVLQGLAELQLRVARRGARLTLKQTVGMGRCVQRITEALRRNVSKEDSKKNQWIG